MPWLRDPRAQMLLILLPVAASDTVFCRRYGSPWVCIHKCIFVADMVLGKRSAATTHAFAAQLVARAEPAEEQEVQKYFVDPQSTSER